MALVPYVRRPRFVLEGIDDAPTTLQIDGAPGYVPSDSGCGWDVDECLQGLVKWNPYWVLGLAPDSRPLAVSLACPQRLAEIHNAYLDLSKRLHPDSRVDAIESRCVVGAVGGTLSG